MTDYTTASTPIAAPLALPAPAQTPAQTGENPLFSLWMLPLTLTRTWMSAWAQSDGRDAERLLDSGEGDQMPVPAPVQESRDSAVFA